MLKSGGVMKGLVRWQMHAALWLTLSMLALPSYARELPDFTELFSKNNAAVVNISTTQKVKRRMPKMPQNFDIPGLPEGHPFGEWLRRFFNEAPQNQEFNTESLGSGFIISNDGYVLTNYHVVEDADEVVVRLSDRRELEAKVIGSDELSDVALLKVAADNLPTVKIGNSKDLKVGQWILAIGSPFGFDHSATAGIISALGRSLPNGNYVPYIQTDAAINPGNSGGPLFNLDGEVIGVNSQIYSRTGGYMGLSFAIPIDVAMDVVQQIKATGHVTRGWLGVYIQDVTRELAESFGLEKPMGALVAKVLPGSPAEKAGIKVGDIILEYNGAPVERSAELPPMVGRTAVGKESGLLVLRQGKKITVKLAVGRLPDQEKLKLSAAGPSSIVGDRLGMDVSDIGDKDEKEKLGVDHGVLVKEVRPGPSKDGGIRAGDVIMMMNNVQIDSADQLSGLVAKLPAGKWVPVLVQRGDAALFLALRLPEGQAQ
jgi:serine protease Do